MYLEQSHMTLAMIVSCLQQKKARYDTTLDQFIDYVKTIYKQSVVENKLNVVKWPPTPSKIFINLACIEWKTPVTRKEADEFTRAMVEDGNVDVIMKKKTPIEFSDIVPNSPNATSKKVILVEGAPGVGKSTFAWEFCRRWQQRKIAQQYQLVLLLRLRDERMSKARCLRDLLYHPSPEVGDAVKDHLIHTLGRKCLIILEGFDELSDTCRTESSIFLELIHGQLLPLATILVTSRSWATSTLLDTCEHRMLQHIEILGFTEHHIEMYVRSVYEGGEKPESDKMKENIEGIMTYIATYPQIKACMYIPLNSAIVVSVYQESKTESCDLPKTLTELYYALTKMLLLRYLHGHPVHSKKIKRIRSIENDLPQEVYEQLLKIGKIAYTGICTDWGDSVQLTYSDLPATFETLGLMQSVSQMYATEGMNVSHNFLHLTVQEFLAALHISKMPPKEQVKHFKRHKEGRFRVILRFLAGLTKLANIPLEQRSHLLEKPHSTSEQDVTYTQMKSDISLSVHALNWLFETQSSDVIKTWLQDKTVDFNFQRQMSPLEYYSAGYCIAHSSAHWVLTIREHKEDTDVKMFCDGITSTEKAAFKVRLKVLIYMTSEKLVTLLTNMGPNIQELHLKLRDGSIILKNLSALKVLHLVLNCKKTFDLTTSLLLQSLESLKIEAGSGNNVLGLKSSAAIRKLSSLKHLKFSSATKNFVGRHRMQRELQIDSKCMESLTKAMAGSTSLPLMSLEVDCVCTFTATAAELLATFITSSKHLQTLHIGSQCTLEQEGVELITEALANNESLPLKKVMLPTLKISDKVSTSLVLFIQRYASIDFFTWESGRTIASFVKAKLHIQCSEAIQWSTKAITCSISLHTEGSLQEGIALITKALAENASPPLKRITLPALELSDLAADSLALLIQKCEFVSWKRDEITLITASGLREMANAEQHYSWLPPGATGEYHHCVVYCIEDGTDYDHIWQHHSFWSTFTCHNIGDEGACSFGASLIKNSRVMRLYFNRAIPVLDKVLSHSRCQLPNKRISNAGATALAQALHHNYTLRELHLSNNSIGDAGVTALAQALHHNSTLRELHLSNNSIGNDGATALAQALHHNSTLRELHLSNNSIGDDGATALAQALHHNFKLCSLNVSGNDAIHVEGACQLVQALSVNKCPEWHWTHHGGLVLSKRCEEFARQCPEYSKVKSKVKLV